MKKHAFSVLLAILMLSALHSIASASLPETDPGGLHLVDEPAAPPKAIQAGFFSITAKDSETYMRFLASDLLEGREVATPGYDIAAEFAAALFRLWRLEPAGDCTRTPASRDNHSNVSGRDGANSSRGYFQEFVMHEVLATEGSIRVEAETNGIRRSRSYASGVDYTSSAIGTWSLTAPVVFAGHGIVEKKLNYDDYRGINVKDKIVLLLSEAPGAENADSPFHADEYDQRYFQPQRRMHAGDPRVRTAAEKGAAAVLLVENRPGRNRYLGAKILDRQRIDDSKPVFDPSRRRLLLPHPGKKDSFAPIPSFHISFRMAAEILEISGERLEKLQSTINSTLKPASRPLSQVRLTLNTNSRTRLVRSRNVLAVIEGADPELKNEVVVIGAHLDHLGRKGPYIFNGADDNASGVCGVLEVAQAFALNPTRPQRTVVFALWTGEESGLLGSSYYVAHPAFPLKRTVANLNLDMISRIWTRDRLQHVSRWWGIRLPELEAEKIKPDRFLMLSRSRGTSAVSEALTNANTLVGMHLMVRPSDGFGGSDHAPFAFNGIPWIFFFSAMTEDYHMPSDSLEKVSFSHLENVSRLVYATAFHLAGWKEQVPQAEASE